MIFDSKEKTEANVVDILNKMAKSKSEVPLANAFIFVPTTLPHLKDLVLSVEMSSVDKTLKLVITENGELDVLKWIAFVSDLDTKKQVSPFVDLEIMVATLYLLDSNKKAIGHIKFDQLTVLSHTCCFAKSSESCCGGYASSDNSNLQLAPMLVKHYVTLHYGQEYIALYNLDTNEVTVKTNEMTDSEWKHPLEKQNGPLES